MFKNFRNKLVYGKAALAVMLLITSSAVYAFKTNTHSWIGQQVLNDLADGAVTIEPFGEFAVDPFLVNQLRRFQDLYLLGTLGPDALPDMIGGQITTHAGVDGGWVTDDWLRHLSINDYNSLSDHAWEAFYRGYLSHAAADVFAHTYVNHYAGKEFLLGDEDHLDVEIRHFMLESYIAKFQPSEVDEDRIFGNVGYYYETFDTGERLPPTLEEQYQFTEDKLREFANRMLVDGITNDISSSIEWIELREPSTETRRELMRYMLWGYDEFAEYYYSNSFTYYWDTIEEIADMDLTVYGQPIYEERVVANAREWDAAITKVLADRLIRDDEVANQYELGGMTTYLAKMDEFEERVIEEAEFINVLLDWIRGELAKAIEKQAYLQSMLDRFAEDGEVRESGPTVRDLNSNVFVCPITDQNGDCTEAEDLPMCDSRNLEHAVAKENDPEVYDLWLAGHCPEALTSRYEEEIVSEAVSSMFSQYPEFAERGRELGFDDMSSNELVETLALAAAIVVFYNDLDFRVLAVQYALANYHSHSVQEATEAYIFAFVETAKYLHAGETVDVITQPVRDWITCYGPVYTGEYAAFMPDVCDLSEEARALADAFKQTTVDAAAYLVNRAGLTEEAVSMLEAYKAFSYRLNVLAQELGRDIVEEVLNEEQIEFISLLAKPVTDAGLNEAFQRDGHSMKLLEIPDMANRVKQDMKLDSEGRFDPQMFPPIYNAIQLSKLALLGESEINRLEELAGLQITNYSQFYTSGKFNILFSWIKSLDGNHQWMPVSPRYPRQEGHDDVSDDSTRKYSVGDGLHLWTENEYQNRLFEQIFLGPIAPSLEDPKSENMKEILPGYYQQRDCNTSPFPQSTNSERCGSIMGWLIPVLHLMN